MGNLKDAAKKAASLTNQQLQEKITRLQSNNINDIINDLKVSVVDKAKVEEAIKEINVATNKNNKLIEMISRGEEIAGVLVDIIKKFR